MAGFLVPSEQEKSNCPKLFRCATVWFHHPRPEEMLCPVASLQQPGWLGLKLQSTNGIRVLLAADAGFDDFVWQSMTCAEEVGAFD